jgi:hypothetical protein
MSLLADIVTAKRNFGSEPPEPFGRLGAELGKPH